MLGRRIDTLLNLFYNPRAFSEFKEKTYWKDIKKEIFSGTSSEE